MKKIIYISIALMVILCAWSCSGGSNGNVSQSAQSGKGTDAVTGSIQGAQQTGAQQHSVSKPAETQENMFCVKLNDKFCFVNSAGKKVIDQQYEKAGPFVDGLACVAVDGKWGVIDRTGKMVIRPQFDDICVFEENLARVEVNKKYGFIDKTGKIVISPQFDSTASRFVDGLAAVKVNNKYGFINKTGKIEIVPQFDNASNFSDGLACVKIGDNYGFINTNGKIVINPVYSFAVSFSEKLARVTKKTTGPNYFEYYFIDTKGNVVFNVPEHSYMYHFSEGLAVIHDNESQYGFVDTNSKRREPTDYTKANYA